LALLGFLLAMEISLYAPDHPVPAVNGWIGVI